MILTLITIVIVAWLVFTYLIPVLPPPVNTIVGIIVAIVLIVWLLELIGVHLP